MSSSLLWVINDGCTLLWGIKPWDGKETEKAKKWASLLRQNIIASRREIDSFRIEVQCCENPSCFGAGRVPCWIPN